jgi:hypothetical protein
LIFENKKQRLSPATFGRRGACLQIGKISAPTSSR